MLYDKVFTRPDLNVIDKYSESTSNLFRPVNPKGTKFSLWLMAESPGHFSIFTPSIALLWFRSHMHFSSMLPDICRWHRIDKVDLPEQNRSMAIARIQSNINPFCF
ncbi:MAG: hypothetical protein IPJ39_14410 [Saprospiraceae bacterium]|nr:hypothetical protein [Saprospiraceae bacterium]